MYKMYWRSETQGYETWFTTLTIMKEPKIYTQKYLVLRQEVTEGKRKSNRNFEICGIQQRLCLFYLQLTQLTVTKREGSKLSFQRPYTETYGCGEVPPIEKRRGGGG